MAGAAAGPCPGMARAAIRVRLATSHWQIRSSKSLTVSVLLSALNGDAAYFGFSSSWMTGKTVVALFDCRPRLSTSG
jgi:hypothetical protein